jgi:uncharacterized protein
MAQQQLNFRGPSRPEPATVNAPSYGDGNTYLHELCHTKAPAAVIEEAVLTLGADLQTLNKKKLPPLGVAILYGTPETVECLLGLGSALYFPLGDDGRCFNAAVLAVYGGRPEVLDIVLKHGGGLHLNKPGVVPDQAIPDLPALHMALFKGHIHILQRLAGAGAALEMEAGGMKLTPLHMASEKGAFAAVKTLLEAGADIEHRQSQSGMTALHYAVLSDRLNAAETLLKAGADPDAASFAGLTPLMIAAGQNNRGLVDLLVKRNADSNRQCSESENQTALMRAAAKGHSVIVSLLLANGADPALADAFNRTAAKHARNSGSTWLAVNLEQAEQAAHIAYFEKVQKKYRP